MYKKMIGACMALAAFAAFAVIPAMASASPVLTHPTGTPMGTCTGCVTATLVNGNALLTDTASTPNTLVTCSSATLTGDLSNNTGTQIEGTITSASYSGTGPNGECTSSFGGITVTPQVSVVAPWCLKSTGGDNWSVTGGDCPGGGRLKFTLDSTTIGECEYESGAAGVAGHFATHPSDAILTVTESSFTKIRGGFFCPSSGKLDQSFTLETDSKNTEPLYIS